MNSIEVKQNQDTACVNLHGVYYRELNTRLAELVNQGVRSLELNNACGQRYIGTSLKGDLKITINGTPGNDLGAFMDGPSIAVNGNVQDCCGNTLNNGCIVVHGHGGDIFGMSARGGKLFVRDYVGYRAGIHMKAYQDKKPSLVIGNTAQDFLGEYMAGGVLVVLGLGLGENETHKANFIGTGMHGGVIYMSGKVEEHQLGKEVAIAELDEADWKTLRPLIDEFAQHFGYNAEEIAARSFYKLYPKYLRPYGRMYAY
ncbi:hypothetical protein [Dehalococcoides mccartyi]|uniref:Glutamate synthase-like protein protein, alpha subunit-like protein n=1 Tax=Dehalococcoides mccartyi (strain VS) TaxID=311424 RepID=D2BIB4_DEHMV|nr:hypothetical protein [Dehalococcoides mccartyi]ACZ62064.1 glutamate synthase-like protein protein, alpha subunit-like protein [Dehalococcoides mccartyi VS]